MTSFDTSGMTSDDLRYYPGIYPESTRSPPGVDRESTRSRSGVDRESTPHVTAQRSIASTAYQHNNRRNTHRHL
jgi:hypothetical protein